MTLLGTFSVLGLGTLLVGELPRQKGQEAPLVSTALVAVGCVGMGTGILFTLLTPFISTNLQDMRTDASSILLFAFGVSLTAITTVLDQALLGLLRGGLQLWRNSLFASGKLAALVALGLLLSQATGMTIYLTWMIGNIVSLLLLAGIALAKGIRPGKKLLPQSGLLRKLGPEALKHHALNLTLQAPTLLLPVFVTVALSAAANAWFYISWNLSSLGNIVASSLTMTLYAVSAAQPQTLARRIRLTLALSFIACFLINVVFLFDTTQVLSFFGKSYAEQAAWSLRILSIESFPFLIKTHFIAVRRIHGRVTPATLVTIATGALEMSGAALGVHLGGLTGLSLGWFIAMCIEVLFMLPAVYKAAFPARISLQKARADLFADISSSQTAALERQPAWLVETLIHPVWLADTLALNAITLPRQLPATDPGLLPDDADDVYLGRTIRLANFQWYSDQETMKLPVLEREQ